MEDGFQSGYDSLSFREIGPFVAQLLCRKEAMSRGLAANLASRSEMGMYVTSSFFPVFVSYALNISLNDCYRIRMLSSDAAESVWFLGTYLGVARNGEGTILQFLSGQVCQNMREVSGNVGHGGKRNLCITITTDRHLPTSDVEVQVPVQQLIEWRRRGTRKHTVPI